MPDNIRYLAFHNAIRILHNLSSEDIASVARDVWRDLGYVDPERAMMVAEAEREFQRDPIMWFIRAPTYMSEAIYEELMQPSQPERLRDKPVTLFFAFDPTTGTCKVNHVHIGIDFASGPCVGTTAVVTFNEDAMPHFSAPEPMQKPDADPGSN